MFMYMQIFYAYLIDIFAFNSAFGGLQFLGASIIVTFSITAAIDKKRTAEKEKE